jgi:hypothetical protein
MDSDLERLLAIAVLVVVLIVIGIAFGVTRSLNHLKRQSGKDRQELLELQARNVRLDYEQTVTTAAEGFRFPKQISDSVPVAICQQCGKVNPGTNEACSFCDETLVKIERGVN